jgi:hypothetical protein
MVHLVAAVAQPEPTQTASVVASQRGSRNRAKTKCPNREEFIVVGWTAPERTRPYLGAPLLVRPELVVGVNYLTWTLDSLLRRVAGG